MASYTASRVLDDDLDTNSHNLEDSLTEPSDATRPATAASCLPSDILGDYDDGSHGDEYDRDGYEEDE